MREDGGDLRGIVVISFLDSGNEPQVAYCGSSRCDDELRRHVLSRSVLQIYSGLGRFSEYRAEVGDLFSVDVQLIDFKLRSSDH